MSVSKALATAAGCVLLAGCMYTTAATPTVENGWTVYRQTRLAARVPCGDGPVLIAGNRVEMHLTGACRLVRISGNHNDVSVEVAPGGTIEITGAHNDVTWTMPSPGARPTLTDSGKENSIHSGAT